MGRRIRARDGGGDNDERRYSTTEELRREAAQILKRSPWWQEEVRQERLEELLAGVDETLGGAEAALIATDLDGMVRYWSESAERLYGWSREEAVGQQITELTVGPQDRTLGERIMESIRETGGWEGEFTVYRRDGSSFRAYVVDELVEDDDGQPAGIIGRSARLPRDP